MGIPSRRPQGGSQSCQDPSCPRPMTSTPFRSRRFLISGPCPVPDVVAALMLLLFSSTCCFATSGLHLYASVSVLTSFDFTLKLSVRSTVTAVEKNKPATSCSSNGQNDLYLCRLTPAFVPQTTALGPPPPQVSADGSRPSHGHNHLFLAPSLHCTFRLHAVSCCVTASVPVSEQGRKDSLWTQPTSWS